MMTPMNRLRVKKDPKTMNNTKYKYMYALFSLCGCWFNCQHNVIIRQIKSKYITGGKIRTEKERVTGHELSEISKENLKLKG